MLSVRWGALRQAQECSAAGLAGRGNRGHHRLRHAKEVLAVVAGWLPTDLVVVLLADRFSGTPR